MSWLKIPKLPSKWTARLTDQAFGWVWLLAVAFLTCLPILADAAPSEREPSFFFVRRSKMKKIRPLWSDPKFIRDSANQSILYSGSPSAYEPLRGSEVAEWLKADQSAETAELRIRYQQLEAYSDSRRAFGQNSFGDQNRTREEKNNLGRDALTAVRNARTDAERRRFMETPIGGEFKEFVKEPAVGTVAAVAAISIGQPVVVNVNKNVRVFARTEVHNQAFDFRMASPAIESRLAFNATAPINAANPNNERYQLAVGRPLPVWALRSDLVYGGSSAMVTASLTKQIAPNLTATLKSEKDSGLSQLPRFRSPQESLTVDYQFRF
ncbi:MAG: hypothetical protein JNL01_07050 [Bdellovibrionales bacterium]|nr:hypothetical protein [Bdellovibrionales bacterium]